MGAWLGMSELETMGKVASIDVRLSILFLITEQSRYRVPCGNPDQKASSCLDQRLSCTPYLSPMVLGSSWSISGGHSKQCSLLG